MLLDSESTSRFRTSRRLCDGFWMMWYSVRTLIYQASSVQMMRTFLPDSLLCQEDSNCSRLHPFRCLNNTSECLQCSISKRISFPNTDMGRQLQPSRRHGYSLRTLSLIRQVVQKTFNRPDVILRCLDSQTLLWKLCVVEVQPFER
jgi:hypothetical protein